MSNLIAAAKVRKVQIDDLSIDVHGTLAATSPRFESITLQVRGQSADESTFDKLIQIPERGPRSLFRSRRYSPVQRKI